MNELVSRLSIHDQPLTVSVRPVPTVSALKECIDRGYVHVKFVETRGGTELSFRLDRDLSELTAGDFTKGTGSIKLVGNLTLNYERVRCIAQIDLQTLSGRGYLQVLQEESLEQSKSI